MKFLLTLILFLSQLTTFGSFCRYKHPCTKYKAGKNRALCLEKNFDNYVYENGHILCMGKKKVFNTIKSFGKYKAGKTASTAIVNQFLRDAGFTFPKGINTISNMISMAKLKKAWSFLRLEETRHDLRIGDLIVFKNILKRTPASQSGADCKREGSCLITVYLGHNNVYNEKSNLSGKYRPVLGYPKSYKWRPYYILRIN